MSTDIGISHVLSPKLMEIVAKQTPFAVIPSEQDLGRLYVRRRQASSGTGCSAGTLNISVGLLVTGLMALSCQMDGKRPQEKFRY